MRVELCQQEIGDYASMTSIDFNLSLLVDLQETFSPLAKDPFAASHLQMHSVPEAAFFISDSNAPSPPSEWSPSPSEESQPLPAQPCGTIMTSPRDNEDKSFNSEAPRDAHPASPRSSLGQSVEIHDTLSPVPSGSGSRHTPPPHTAPLLDSRVYIFYTHATTDEFDFACMGHGRKPRRDSFSNEGRSLSSGRSRAWSSPGRPQTSLYLTKSPHAPTRIISGPMGREKKLLARGSPEPIKKDAPLGGRCPPLETTILRRSRAGMRISNKWGEHPPEGYF